MCLFAFNNNIKIIKNVEERDKMGLLDEYKLAQKAILLSLAVLK